MGMLGIDDIATVERLEAGLAEKSRLSGGNTFDGVQTFVVPAGQSFRIVDDADNPSFQFGVSRNDLQPDYIDFGLYIPGGGDLPGVQSMVSVGAAGRVIKTDSYSNENGYIQHVLDLREDGETRLTCNANLVRLTGIPTYADNAAALAAGLPVGADYNTPAGVRMVVMPG